MRTAPAALLMPTCTGREQRRRRWGAPRAMLLAGAPLAALKVQGTEAGDCEQRDRQLDGLNAPGWVASEERAATSVRRVGGEATLRALALADRLALIVNRVPEVSLRWRRVLLVTARFSPCGAARGSATLAICKIVAFVAPAIIGVIRP